jgi:hypothetical protein
MASTFTWLDYSEHERRKVLDVIEVFSERETRDELGIGSVRDGFADLLFPGTSTIQTRARYFLFIPWIYARLEARGVPSASIASKARQEEVRLIDALAGSDDSEGTIGVLARGLLQRLPSTIYWQGLGVWGIRLYPGSLDQYHRSVDSMYLSSSWSQQDDEGEPVGSQATRSWHAGLPAAPPYFPKVASLRLTKVEAEYLRERIMSRVPRSLLAFLADHGKATPAPVDFPWEHPQRTEFPRWIQEQLKHGRNFSEVIHGAALLYNLMLAEKANREDLIARYRERLVLWRRELEGRWQELAGWDRGRFWEIVESSGARNSLQGKVFINSWLDLALSPKTAEELMADGRAHRLIRERERALKGTLARLDNRRALELWGGDAGTGRLSYRWPVARQMVRDVLVGLAGEG